MPIGCGDAPVFPGDVIVGDGEGVVVIPAHLADEVADEAVEMTAFEDFVTEGDARAARSSACTRPPTSRAATTSPPGARRRGADGHAPLRIATIVLNTTSESDFMSDTHVIALERLNKAIRLLVRGFGSARRRSRGRGLAT